jgi:hypothetical protein
MIACTGAATSGAGAGAGAGAAAAGACGALVRELLAAHMLLRKFMGSNRKRRNCSNLRETCCKGSGSNAGFVGIVVVAAAALTAAKPCWACVTACNALLWLSVLLVHAAAAAEDGAPIMPAADVKSLVVLPCRMPLSTLM